MLAGLLRITTEGMPRRVVFKRTSLVFCQVIIFNLVATPFLVNIFEASSFDEAPRLSETFPKPASYINHTSSRVFANHLQMHYNASSLPPQARYYRDRVNFIDVMRTPVSVADCTHPSTLLGGILGVVYFPSDAKQAVLDCICANVSCHVVPRSWHFTVVTKPVSTSVLWIVPGDDSLNVESTAWTVYYAYVPDVNRLRQTEKSMYRLIVGFAILARLFRSYGIHVLRLRSNLQQFPFHATSTAVRYEIELGDPTCIITADPWLCVAFLIDIWATTEIIGQACLRMCQMDDLVSYGLAILCLGRTVWCSFGALVIVNSLRRWSPNLRLYPPLNSTILVLLAYIIAALLPLAQSQWPPLVEVYTWLFSIVRTFDEEGQTVTLDNVFVMIVYLLSMCAMPFGVGIAQDLWRKLHRRLYPKQRVSPSKFHTKLATQSLGKPRIRRHSRGSKGRIKNSRVASHWFHAKSSVSEYIDSTFRAPSATDGVFHGDGTLGELFRLNPLVRVQATLSQRGISCRVRGYDSQDTLVDDARVHLISQIDTKQIRLFQSQDSQAAVGVLVLLLGDTEKLEVVLHRGRLNSPWIIS
ncbi:unnamed protein product [Aphanomyces euteiches]